MRRLDDITNTIIMNLGKLWKVGIGRPGVVQSMGSQRVGHNLVTKQNITILLGMK